jgi:methylmalonyl-CoA mutase N-terminal domain/subunit
VIDPLGGSYYVEALTDEIEKEMLEYLKRIEEKGGMVKAIESGWMQDELSRSAYQRQKEIEEGRRIVVGVNKFVTPEKIEFKIHEPNPEVSEEMKRRLERLRKERDQSAVERCLRKIRDVARGKENLVPFVLEAVKNYATIGEICATLKEVFGEYRPNR